MSSNQSYNSWELAQGIAEGNPTIFNFSKTLFIKKIRGMLVKKRVHKDALQQKAEDAFGEALFQFLKMWQEKTYKEEGKFIAFFMRLANCSELNRYNKDKKCLGEGDISVAIGDNREDLDVRSTESFFPDPEYQKMAEITAEKMQTLHRHFPSLSANQRQVLELKYKNGYNLQEIADKMGKSLENIKQMHRNAKIRLQQLCKFERM